MFPFLILKALNLNLKRFPLQIVVFDNFHLNCIRIIFVYTFYCRHTKIFFIIYPEIVSIKYIVRFSSIGYIGYSGLMQHFSSHSSVATFFISYSKTSNISKLWVFILFIFKPFVVHLLSYIN